MQDQVSGAGWKAANIIGVLSELQLGPQPAEASPDDELRIIAAFDGASQLHFGAIYQPQSGDRLSNLSFICMIPAPGVSAQDAEAINTRLPMALAFVDEGFLWIYAELNTQAAFSKEFFRSQTLFYLSDMRTALQLLLGGGEMSFAAARAFKAMRQRGGGDLIRKLSNERQAEPERHERPAPSPAPVQSYAAETCPRCDGSGKRLFRPCRDCKGTGERI